MSERQKKNDPIEEVRFFFVVSMKRTLVSIFLPIANDIENKNCTKLHGDIDNNPRSVFCDTSNTWKRIDQSEIFISTFFQFYFVNVKRNAFCFHGWN